MDPDELYLGDPLGHLGQKKVKKSSPETWGERHIQEVIEWNKHKRNWQQLDLHGSGARIFYELERKRARQLLAFKELENLYDFRSGLKKDFFLKPMRVQQITFGRGKFYKMLDHHIGSLRSLNKTLEALPATLGFEGPPAAAGIKLDFEGPLAAAVINDQISINSKPSNLDDRAISGKDTASVREDREQPKQDPALEILVTINMLLEFDEYNLALNDQALNEHITGDLYFFGRKLDAFQRWLRSRKTRMDDGTVLILADIAWSLTSCLPDEVPDDSKWKKKTYEQMLNDIFTRIGFPEREHTWECLTMAQFLPTFGELIDALEARAELQQKNHSWPSRIDLAGQSLSYPSSRDVSIRPSARTTESPRTSPAKDLSGPLTLGEQHTKVLNAVHGSLTINNHYTRPGNEQSPTSYSLSLPSSNFQDSSPRSPWPMASAAMQIAQDPTTIVSSSGITPTVKAAIGVGVPTAVAGVVGAISSATNAVVAKQTATETIQISKDNLKETIRKNDKDLENKQEELKMAKEKHDLEKAKLEAEKVTREREEAERIKLVDALLVGVSPPRNNPRSDEDDRPDDPPDNAPLALSSNVAVTAVSMSAVSASVESHRTIQGVRAPTTAERVEEITDDLYSDDSGYGNLLFGMPGRLEERDTATHTRVVAIRDPNGYELDNLQPVGNAVVVTTASEAVNVENFTNRESTEQDHSMILTVKGSASQEHSKDLSVVVCSELVSAATGAGPPGPPGPVKDIQASPSLHHIEAQQQQTTDDFEDNTLPGKRSDLVNAPVNISQSDKNDVVVPISSDKNSLQDEVGLRVRVPNIEEGRPELLDSTAENHEEGKGEGYGNAIEEPDAILAFISGATSEIGTQNWKGRQVDSIER